MEQPTMQTVKVEWEIFRVVSREVFEGSNDLSKGTPCVDTTSGQSVLVCTNGLVKIDGANNATYWARKEQYTTHKVKNRQGVRRRHKAKRIHKP